MSIESLGQGLHIVDGWIVNVYADTILCAIGHVIDPSGLTHFIYAGSVSSIN